MVLGGDLAEVRIFFLIPAKEVTPGQLELPRKGRQNGKSGADGVILAARDPGLADGPF